MPKSRNEKIANYDTRIAKLHEQRKKELEKQRQEERKEREKRLLSRGEVLEKILPDTINLTTEQFTTFINKTAANNFGRDKLAEIIKENEAAQKSQTTPPNENPTPTS